MRKCFSQYIKDHANPFIGERIVHTMYLEIGGPAKC